MKARLVFGLAVALAGASLIFAEVDLTGAKCPVVGHEAKEGGAVDYKGGKVFFCCAGCDEEFKNNAAKYAAKANHQLFVTGQAKQVACPLSGAPTTDELAAKVDGANVKFCCESCLEKVNAASEEEKLQLIFSDEAFDKAFRVGE